MASWQIRNWLSNNLRRVASCSVSTQAALPKNTCAAFSLIRSQPSQYIVASLAGRKYLLAPRDLLTVPHLKDVRVGDVLALQDIHEVGSRDYTLRGDPVISPSRVKVEATVVEHTKGKMEVVFKKKRRKGYQKTIKNKHPYTRLRIGSIEFPEPSNL
ncbi:ribosomal protein L21-like protein [Suillus subalutaceus]|uniref:ribosomal protein L21-like protein n=1 Tax=Suillus subalutaceus TaxID=48586 RepID=UPI001B85B416|nr:ribosomal protein L21-like protein [Suillus subalutaceus]KAG1876708.1 ribosomal protein L21-like protein [Suillus subalutaceus]KAG1887772.1 ribosomal protein L21-like protein [Suillus subluteus]